MLTFSRIDLLEQPVAMKKSLFILLAFALLNSGCSTISLVYRNADRYLQYKIDGYTTFNARQKETIRHEVSDYMLWHHKSALPEYILFLQNLNGTIQYDGQLGVAEVARLRVHLLDLYHKTLVPAIRPTARLLSTLDSPQINELGRSFARNNQEYMHEVLDGSHDDILNRRADKTVDFLEWLAGNLSNEQEHKVREMSRRLPVANHIFLQNREANQGRLIALLNAHADADKIAAFLSSWMLTPETTRTAQQQHVIQSLETASDEMIAQIHGMLTVRQKDHIRKLISTYINDMQSISLKSHAASGTTR